MCSAWQKKLHASVHDDGHKAEIYKYLWMLMTEGDPTVFKKKLGGFSNKRKEPRFNSYFKGYYANRVGEHKRSLYSII